MALADYRLCDVCGNKAFYDANLNYTFPWDGEPIPEDEKVREGNYKLDYLGDWAVLCRDCAKTHVAVVMKKEDIGPTDAAAPGVQGTFNDQPKEGA
jgi:hypothetical protein